MVGCRRTNGDTDGETHVCMYRIWSEYICVLRLACVSICVNVFRDWAADVLSHRWGVEK